MDAVQSFTHWLGELGNKSLGPVAFTTFVAGPVLLAILTGHLYTGWFLRRWAKINGYRLISHRGVPFWENKAAFWRSENQDMSRIVVEDQDGRKREGLVTRGNYWLPYFLSRKITVIWDDKVQR